MPADKFDTSPEVRQDNGGADEPFWTDAKVERMLGLLASGFSASLVGEEIGASRNAVLGKAFRLRLPPRPTSQVTIGKSSQRRRWRGRKVTIGISFEPSVHERIAELARTNGTSIAHEVRVLVDAALSRAGSAQ